MIPRSAVLLAIASIVCCTRAASNSSTPVINQFLSIAYHATIILDNKLYIDGGEITDWSGQGTGQYGEGGENEGNLNITINSYTRSIDLTQQWINSTVYIGAIPKDDTPQVNGGALWPDASGGSFYAYGGASSLSPNQTVFAGLPSNSLWQFTPADDLNGTWSQASILANSDFSQLQRTTGGSTGYGDGNGYSLGGETRYLDGDGYVQSEFVPGMVIYNQTTQEWQNVSSKAYSSSGLTSNGVIQYVPSFGSQGLLFVLGGYIVTEPSSGLNQPGTADSNAASFNFAYMYNPATGQWDNQKVTGDIPTGVASPCAVGVQGKDSYEIFLYGGWANSNEDTINHGAVYVLSLPAFQWFRQDITPTVGRWMHTCNVAGHTRQMISVGGITINSSSVPQLFEGTQGMPDPWAWGLGVFDLTAMEWKTSFEPDAGAYVTPNMIQQYYSDNGRDPAEWSSPTVQTWFTTEANSTNTSTPTASPTPSPHHQSDAGAIAGGVVGGVLGLLLIAALAFWLLRRRRRDRQQSGRPRDPSASFGAAPAYETIPMEEKREKETHEPHETHELEESGWRHPSELEGRQWKQASELEGGRGKSGPELEGSGPAHELSAD